MDYLPVYVPSGGLLVFLLSILILLLVLRIK